MKLPLESVAFLAHVDGVDLDEGDRVWTRTLGSCRRWPCHLHDPVPESTWRSLFRKGRMAVAWAVETPAPDRPANGYWYVCRDREFDIDKLSANSRSKVRRGLKRTRVEEVPAADLESRGRKAMADTWRRFGYVPDQRSFERMSRRASTCPGIRIFAAEGASGFTAWVVTLPTGEGHFIYDLASTDEDHRNYPNNAILFVLLRRLLAEEGAARVDFGVSSLQPRSRVNTLHKFKLSMGFEAVPVHREIRFHPFLFPLTTRPARTLVRAAASAFPSSIKVQKLWGALECHAESSRCRAGSRSPR